jgi:hypothetical protein
LAVLSAPSIAYATQVVGSSSAIQYVTLTNSGGAALAISAVAVSGDFSVTNNNCGSSLSAGGQCTISMNFAPTASGSRSGTLTISDNASGSPQTVLLSGTGSSANISSNPTSLSISSPGGSASSVLTVSSVFGFAGTVNLACGVTYQGVGSASDLPICTLSTSQVAVSSTASQTVTLGLSTTAGTAKGESPVKRGLPEQIVFAALVVGYIRRRMLNNRSGFLSIALLGLAFLSVSGCGSGGSSGSKGDPGSSIGSYSVVVSVSDNAVLSSVTIPVTLQ